MKVDLEKTLVVAVSATALFDMSAADDVFQEAFKENPETAVENYRAYMLKREEDDLADGTAMPLVSALLGLNQYQEPGEVPLVEVVVMSRNSPETGVVVFNNIRRRGLNISRHAFTGGESVVPYLEAYDVDLFLTTNVRDAQKVIDAKSCASAIVQKPPHTSNIEEGQVRLAFDGDAVLFDDSSEIVFKAQGLKGFFDHEDEHQDVPMPEGPYAQLLRSISQLQSRLPFNVKSSPVRIAIVTARSAPAEMRVIKTLRTWGVYVDEVFFLGGLDKSKILKAFRPHIFFEDQDLHLEEAAKYVPSGKVPYKSESEIHKYLK